MPYAGGPLQGVRILDMTRLLPGGVLTALLGDLGAEVIKVEDTKQGDYMRWEEPRIGSESAASWIVGRNKRSLAVDLKDDRGREVFLDLVEGADVVLEGFRPGVVDRLGVGYEVASARNPKVVYASLYGYGSEGPMADVAGHDVNYISYAGVLGMTGPPGGPVCPPGVQVGDLGGAMMVAIGILAALHRAQMTGRGDQVEVSMYDAALAWTSIHAGEYWASGKTPDPGRMLLNGQYPCYGVYACADGRYVSVGAIEEKFWVPFCETIGRPDLIDRRIDPDAREDVAATIASRSREAWVDAFHGIDACVAPVLDLGEALSHPLAEVRHMVRDAPHPEVGTAKTLGTPIRLRHNPPGIGTPPPRHGADGRAILKELGHTDDEIATLLDEGVVREPDELSG